MHLVRNLNYFSYASVFLSYIVTGVLLSDTPFFFKFAWDQPLAGKPMPPISEWFMEDSTHQKPLIVGIAEGGFFLCLLLYLDCSTEQKRALVPVTLTAALTLNFVQLVVFFGAMAFLPFTDYISQPTGLGP